MRITRPGFGLDRDSTMTSSKRLNPGTVDALDMDNGLVSLSYGVACIGAHHIVRHSAGLSVFHCSMMAFIRDSFMISHEWLNPAPMDPLGLDNGLMQPSFRAQCTGPPHPVGHISEFGMLFTVLCSPSFATRS